MRILQYITLILTTLFLFSFNPGNKGEWKLEKNKNGIKVYSRILEGESLKEIKMSSTVNARLSSAVSVLIDVKHYPEWIYRCPAAKIVKQINKTELIYYGISDAPWPIENRDMVLRNKIHQDEKTGIVYSITVKDKDFVPVSDDMIRIPELSGKWFFAPMKDGKLYVEYYLNIDIGGTIPDWVTNMFITVGPYHSMTKFKEALKLDRHKNSKFDFIKEP